MAALRERTRRLLTTLLFVCFGPALLGYVGYRLYWRTSPAAFELEKARLAAATRFDVDFSKREFLRPSVRRLTGCELSTPESGETAVFCPEIYFVCEKNVDLLADFARLLDERAGRDGVSGDEDADVGPKSNAGSGVKTAEFVEIVEDEKSVPGDDEPSALTELIFSENSENVPHEYCVVVAPTVYCRDSQIIGAKKRFCDAFFREIESSSSAFPNAPGRIVCFVAERIVFQDDFEFDATRREFDAAAIPKKSRRDLTAIFRAAALAPKGAVDLSPATTRRETLAFSAEAPVVENFRALRVDSPSGSRLDAQFQFAKTPSGRPAFVSLAARREPKRSRFEVDAVRAPIPGAFAARFFPIFGVSTDASWFVGRVVATDSSDFGAEFFGASAFSASPVSPNVGATAGNADEAPFLTAPERVWTARLNDFHFRELDVATLTEKLDLPRFTGTITDFSVENGAIRRGVFLGKGALKIEKGTLPQEVLSRACATGQLETTPSSALSLRFVDDAVPFAEFETLFETRRDGIALDSKYKNKIVAYYRGSNVQYGVFLPKSVAGRVVPYSKPIAALLGARDVGAFWSPLFREALNHLPIETPRERTETAAPTSTSEP